MLESINSGRFTDTPAGRYLESLKRRLKGPVVADLLCYLRLHAELALRAKGILMMRENGFDATIDDETRAKFAELALSGAEHGQDRDAGDPSTAAHESPRSVAALHAGEQLIPAEGKPQQPSSLSDLLFGPATALASVVSAWSDLPRTSWAGD